MCGMNVRPNWTFSMDLTTSPGATLPCGVTKTSTNAKRAWKPYCCGYILDRAWYKAEAQARFCSPNETPAMYHRTRFLFGLVAEAGLGGVAHFRNVKFRGRSALCVALASNKSESAMILPAQEKIEKLKTLLGTEEPPKWYEYDG